MTSMLYLEEQALRRQKCGPQHDRLTDWQTESLGL